MTDLEMLPAPGSRQVRHAGDFVTFTLRARDGRWPEGWGARLRTNLGRAERVREEIVQSHFQRLPLAGASWRDLPMRRDGEAWTLTLPATEVGCFRAKAYAVDERGFQHWPGGPDFCVSVHPSWTRTGNTLYCAFPRMFGPSRGRVVTADPEFDRLAAPLDRMGCAVIPPGGTLRDLARQLPHIFDRLGCRLLHLLPVGPTPTTFARFGRFGSPYAVQDLTAIDPALVEFDRRTTGVQQFEELTEAVHARGGRVLIDIVINHTGWGSREWNNHPGWFVRKPDGTFESPGAWDVVWEDLVELDQCHPDLWDYLARAFLTWCRRGVDGFRCDAGYKIPAHVWQYITARVRQEFPDTVFLLEGLGGSWEATDTLLADGGMQWAYSELFQNFAGDSLTGYLDHTLRAATHSGVLVHYSETHDNARLAARGLTEPGPATPEGRMWSLHRNQLCALTSIQGGFGFTCGVEWCATEQVNVHSSRGLAWDHPDHLVDELHALNRLLADHPCFFDGARVERLPATGSAAVALRRESAEGPDRCLVLANPDLGAPADVHIDRPLWEDLGEPRFDLVESYAASDATPAGPARWEVSRPAAADDRTIRIRLAPGACVCLAATPRPQGLSGDAYRRARARADWAVTALATVRRATDVPHEHWTTLAAEVEADPAGFLAASFGDDGTYHRVVVWTPDDTRRVVPVPEGHWLLLQEDAPFRARLHVPGHGHAEHRESIAVHDGHVLCFNPRSVEGIGELRIERHGTPVVHRQATVRFLAAEPSIPAPTLAPTLHGPLVLLTNGRGGMARIPVDLGRITSKYDCLLGANLHPRVPVDRHVMVKRLRAWVNADGFITPLDAGNLVDFESGPPAHWRFVANAGDGRSVEIHLVADLLDGENTVQLQFSRPDSPPRFGRSLPPGCDVRLTLRLDLEDRSFHAETHRSPGADHHFSTHTHPLTFAIPNGNGVGAGVGFEFTPAPDRRLRVVAESGVFHHQPEWCEHIAHPIEGTRGQPAAGDAYSPGWFDIPLATGGQAGLTLTTESHLPDEATRRGFVAARLDAVARAVEGAPFPATDRFGRTLAAAARAYLVRRDDALTVVAGYPWFLDWGRDTLIAARGLLAAGAVDEVRGLLLTFARFEDRGTLPNSIHGEDARNRDTSDAPLWWGVVCEEYAARAGTDWYATPVGDAAGRTVADVLRDLASGMLAGTPNGIRVDPASGLLWSPSHFTWMDTNHPPGTPREGYPVEIQALWIRLLRHLDRIGQPAWDGRGESWADLARRAEKSFHAWFWL